MNSFGVSILTVAIVCVAFWSIPAESAPLDVVPDSVGAVLSAPDDVKDVIKNGSDIATIFTIIQKLLSPLLEHMN